MESEDIQKRLEKLKKIEEGNRKRSKKYIKKQEKKGKKMISAIISLDAYKELNNRRDASIKETGKVLTIGEVIEQALFQADKEPISISDNTARDMNVEEPIEQSEPLTDQPHEANLEEPEPQPEDATTLVLDLNSKGMSAMDIAAELQKRGIKTKQGKESWNLESVTKILKQSSKKKSKVS